MRDPRSGREPRQRIANALAITTTLLVGCATEPADPDPPPFGPQTLTDYRERFYRAVRDAEARPTTTPSQAILSRRFVLFGDRHDDSALHERLLDPLATVIQREERPVLVLEGFSSDDDVDLELLRQGRIGVDTLKSRALDRDPDHWLDHRVDIDRHMLPWMLRICSELDCPTYGLEARPRPVLDQRVQAMEANLRRIAARTDATRVFVWVGRAHTVGPGSLGERMKDDAVVVLGTDRGVLESASSSQELLIDDHSPVVVLLVER